MHLSSTRFASARKFVRIANETSSLRIGERGRVVQIVQQGLIDIGFSLGSSDSIFGRNTEFCVKQFQKRYQLLEDGIIGSKTLAKLDNLLSGYQHQIRVHFRSINLTNVGFGQIIESTKNVYAQYGIKVEMASGRSLYLTSEQTKKYFSIKTGCEWTISSGEVFELQGLGGSVPSNEILVYFVNKFDDVTLLGCGGHARNRPAATVASNASQWDTAHEIGHVLLTSAFSPVHSTASSNLMYAYSNSSSSIPTLNNRQLTQIRQSVCCLSI